MASAVISGSSVPGSSTGLDTVLCSCARHKWVPVNLILGSNSVLE